MDSPHRQENKNQSDLKRLEVNAQITALITLIEFLGNLTMVLHLVFVKSNLYSSMIHIMVVYSIISPYALLSNTYNNKNRIIAAGWRNIFKNFLGMKDNSDKDSIIHQDNGSDKERIESNNGFSNSCGTKMLPAEECVEAKKRLVIKNAWSKEKCQSNKDSYIASCSKNFNNRNKKKIFEKRKSSIFIITPPPRCFFRKSKIGNEDSTYEVKSNIKSRMTPCPISKVAKNDIDDSTRTNPSIYSEEKSLFPDASLTHYHCSYLRPKTKTEKECKLAALQTREHLLLQMIHDIQDEPKYLKDFTCLILFEEQRQKGIILSQMELNHEFILEPALIDGHEKGKCKGIKSHSRKGVNDLSSSGNKNQNDMRENCNHNDGHLRIRLLGTPRQRKIQRKKLLNKYHESDDSDESMKSLIDELIVLEEGFIVN